MLKKAAADNTGLRTKEMLQIYKMQKQEQVVVVACQFNSKS